MADLYDRRAQLLRDINDAVREMAESHASAARLRRLMSSIRNAPLQLSEYSDTVTRELLESVKVIDADNLMVVLKSGIEIEATIEG